MMSVVGEVKIERQDSFEKSVFDTDQMELDDRFEELKQPVYKGKKLDDPIPSAVVLPTFHLLYCKLWLTLQ